MHLDLHHHAGNLVYLRHARKILDCAHAQGLRLLTEIDSIRLRLLPFAYDSAYPSESSSEPLSEPTGLLVPIACCVAMVAAKNSVITTTTATMTTG